MKGKSMDALLGTAGNPVYIRWISDNKSQLLVSVTMVTILMVMQNPALRQAIKMRAAYYGMKICSRNVAYWKRMETIASHSYDVARL